MTGRSNLFAVFLCRPKLDDPPINIQATEIASCKWMPQAEFLERLGKLQKPGSLYYVLSELGVKAGTGDYDGMGIGELDIGFKPGTNRVYRNPNRAKL